jgi:hypothetical protein
VLPGGIQRPPAGAGWTVTDDPTLAPLLAALAAGGEPVTGRVVAEAAAGVYLFVLRGRTLVAASDVPLAPDQTVRITAEPALGGQVRLRLTPEAVTPQIQAHAQTLADEPALQLLRLGVPDTPPARVVLAAFQAAGAPLDPGRIAVAAAAVAALSEEAPEAAPSVATSRRAPGQSDPAPAASAPGTGPIAAITTDRPAGPSVVVRTVLTPGWPTAVSAAAATPTQPSPERASSPSPRALPAVTADAARSSVSVAPAAPEPQPLAQRARAPLALMPGAHAARPTPTAAPDPARAVMGEQRTTTAEQRTTTAEQRTTTAEQRTTTADRPGALTPAATPESLPVVALRSAPASAPQFAAASVPPARATAPVVPASNAQPSAPGAPSAPATPDRLPALASSRAATAIPDAPATATSPAEPAATTSRQSAAPRTSVVPAWPGGATPARAPDTPPTILASAHARIAAAGLPASPALIALAQRAVSGTTPQLAALLPLAAAGLPAATSPDIIQGLSAQDDPAVDGGAAVLRAVARAGIAPALDPQIMAVLPALRQALDSLPETRIAADAAPVPQAEPQAAVVRAAREAASETVFKPAHLDDYDQVVALPLLCQGQPTPARLAVAARGAPGGGTGYFLRVDAALSRLGPISVRLSGADQGPVAITIVADAAGARRIAAGLDDLAADLHALGTAAGIRVVTADEVPT